MPPTFSLSRSRLPQQVARMRCFDVLPGIAQRRALCATTAPALHSTAVTVGPSCAPAIAAAGAAPSSPCRFQTQRTAAGAAPRAVAVTWPILPRRRFVGSTRSLYTPSNLPLSLLFQTQGFSYRAVKQVANHAAVYCLQRHL